jgi:hypothetical protein
MAVYCTQRSDDALLADLGQAKRILLVGCPICPSMSCAVNQRGDLPAIAFTLTGIKAVCLANEMGRVSNVLTQKGASVHSWVPGGGEGLCMLAEPARKKLVKNSHNGEAVVVFSCDSGKKNVESILPDRQVLAAMHATGLLRAVTRRRLGRVFVDKQTVDVMNFTLQ